jgi:glyceraldehyde-3-phosphate dehydrogenase/erythrose-4-phosphate dehydrogenase
MAIRIGINGVGRMGRLALRAASHVVKVTHEAIGIVHGATTKSATSTA